jgi:antitoxin component HigA of HigAB toxin-antitoxin module
MTGAGLNDPDEAIREAERRDLEAERKEAPEQEHGLADKTPKPDASDGDEDKRP